MRVVLDTNVLISAMIRRGKPFQLLTKLLDRGHIIIISKPILEEFSRISATKKIGKYVTTEQVSKFLEALANASTYINVTSSFKILGDADDLILATAHDGKADFIASGDGALLGLRTFRHVKILSVDRMLLLI